MSVMSQDGKNFTAEPTDRAEIILNIAMLKQAKLGIGQIPPGLAISHNFKPKEKIIKYKIKQYKKKKSVASESRYIKLALYLNHGLSVGLQNIRIALKKLFSPGSRTV